jgi:hypothetical protein
MATSSTLRLVHPDVNMTHEARPASESWLRRFFRSRARRRRAAVAGWREEAAFRGMTRMGA